MKTCTKCHVTKSESEFYKHPTSKDGLSPSCKSCKDSYEKEKRKLLTPEQRLVINERARNQYSKSREYRSEYERSRYRLYKQDIQSYKSDRGCLVCGETDPFALDFHHVAEKSYDIGKGNSHSAENSKAEMNKCVVLCANCHRKLHAGRWQLTDRIEFIKAQYPEAYELLSTLT